MISFIKGLLGNSAFDIQEEEVRELCKNNRKVELIDVRTMPEYKMEHINPCRNIDIKENCQKMGGHIDFVENVYETVKAPLSYISNKIGGSSLPVLENKN